MGLINYFNGSDKNNQKARGNGQGNNSGNGTSGSGGSNKSSKSNTSNTRKLYVLLSIIVFTLLVSFVISQTGPFRTLELKVTDQLFKLRGPATLQDSSIVIVEINDQAYSEIPHKWPFPTDLYAKVIDNLNEAGAKAIGVDILFNKEDRIAPSHDTTFAESLKEHGNVILAGKISSEVRGNSTNGNISGRSSQLSLVPPINVLRDYNPNKFGLISVERDRDGFLRRYIFGQDFMNERYYTFGFEILKEYIGKDSVTTKNTNEYFKYGPFKIPKYNNRSLLINYYGGRGTFPRYSFDGVIDDSTYTTVMEKEAFEMNNFTANLLPNEVFKDKIVLIGSTQQEEHDFFPTPFAGNNLMPGVEVHANAIQTILEGNYIRNAEFHQNILIMAIAGILVILISFFSRSWLGFVSMITLFVGYSVATTYLFVNQNILLPLTSPLLAILTGYLTTTTYEVITEQREKKRIKNMFASYVSPSLVNQMVESGQDPQLGGDEVYVTAFFSDIQSFSSFSEKLEAKKLVTLMNEYLSAMTDILTEQGGTLDKYIGDAIVAFYGAPLSQEDHAYRACIASQLMQHKNAELRKKWKAEGDKWPEIVWQMRTRIGLNTGWMTTGNIGSTRRFNYTMMGDNVNLAERCESGAKNYGVYTMVTEDTKNEAEKSGNSCVFRFLDRIIVVGRSQPVNVYEIMDLKEYMQSSDFECKEIFEEGIQEYLNQNWDKAQQLFTQSAELEPHQPGQHPGIKTHPSNVMVERCKEMVLNPPGEDWNGVYVMESK